jgi:hypothetical protein
MLARIALTCSAFAGIAQADSIRPFDPMTAWRGTNVAPALIMIGEGADVRLSALNVFGGDNKRIEAFETKLREVLGEELAQRGLPTSTESHRYVEVDIWGRFDEDRECPRIICSLDLWFADSSDPSFENATWTRDVIGSAADSSLEATLLSTVVDLLDFQFPVARPSPGDQR